MINKIKIIKISIISLFILSFSSNVFAIEKNNENINETNLSEDLNKKLYDAIENKNLLLVKELVSKGIKVNQIITFSKEFKEITPLMWASKKGNNEMVKFLLSKGANVNDKDFFGKTSLMIASENGYKSIVETLINNNADLNSKIVESFEFKDISDFYEYGVGAPGVISNMPISRSPTMLEILYDKKKAKKFDEKFKINYGYTALMFALDKKNTEIAELLINKGADINEKDFFGNTVLMIASEKGEKKIVQLLINKGVNVNEKNKDDYNSLILASKYGHEEIIELLLNNKAELNSFVKGITTDSNYNFFIPINQNENDFIKKNKSAYESKLFELIINKISNINETLKDGSTALMIAIKSEIYKKIENERNEINQKKQNERNEEDEKNNLKNNDNNPSLLELSSEKG
ncbi:MAG: ankyrin repeat domain-containing protein, partial [Cyanobacteriota bacterium]